MKGLTVVNIEKAIKEFETRKGIKMEFSIWDLSKYIWNYFAKDMKYGLRKNSLIGRVAHVEKIVEIYDCLLYTSPSPRDRS